MKFSVAPESTRASVSALFLDECTYERIVIDLRADINTSFEACLIQAVQIRPSENPGAPSFVLPRWMIP
jgi:hypothetical protein